MVKRLSILVAIILALALVAIFALPAFAQTQFATWIPGQPLSDIAAEQIITNSGLPNEVLPDGMTSSVTRGRDAVNAYRYAHSMLYTNGWYRGISEDHTPLLKAMVGVLEKEGYTSEWIWLGWKAPEVLQKFWFASNTQNAKDLGFVDFYSLKERLDTLEAEKKITEYTLLQEAFDAKWQ